MTAVPVRGSARAVGIDIGGSGARAAVVDLASGSLAGPLSSTALSPNMTSAQIISALTSVIDATGATPDLPVGIGVPGFVDDSGCAFFCVNMRGLNGLELPAVLGRTGRTVPDLAAWAVAESRFGVGRGAGRCLTVAVGTGVNAQLTVGGALVVTAAGCNGDAGHVIVEPDGPRCACGGIGCLEAVCSAGALERESGLGLGALIERARNGDPRASGAFDRAGAGLGRAMASWVAVFWPDVIAIGGGVADGAGDLLLSTAEAELRRVGVPYLVDRVTLAQVAPNQSAPVIGAAVLAVA